MLPTFGINTYTVVFADTEMAETKIIAITNTSLKKDFISSFILTEGPLISNYKEKSVRTESTYP